MGLLLFEEPPAPQRVELTWLTTGLPGEKIQPLNADHRHVCKFESRLDSNYADIRNALSKIIDEIERDGTLFVFFFK